MRTDRTSNAVHRTVANAGVSTSAAFALSLWMAMLAAHASAAPNKVEVCHIPPDDPTNFHTIRVPEKAYAKHLAHGDLAGACDDLCAVLCDDGNACTIDDSGDCEDNGCPASPEPVDCNDSNACTADSCDPATGCEYVALTGTTCSVAEPGTCEKATGVCDSTGSCDPDRTPGCCLSTAECEAWDINLCTSEECIDTACVTTSTVTCETDACHMSVCIEATGECTPPQEVVCPDPECHDNGCDPVTGCYSNGIDGCCVSDLECDDANNCTTDVCFGVDGCVNTPCAAGDACNVLVDCDPLTCEPQTVPETCEDDGDLCTAESCVEGLGCVSDPVSCPEGEVCNAGTGACEASCFTMRNAAGSGDSIAGCIAACQPYCPSGICELKFQNATLVNQCLIDGDLTACDTIDAFGAQNGCNICPAPEPEGPDLLLCGGTACARYDAGIGDLANPVVRNFIDEYMYFHPEDGGPKGFNFAQAIAPDGRYLWASDCGVCRDSDNFTNVWVYDTLLKELVSCDSWGAQGQLSRVCEDSALNLCVGSVCGPEVSNGDWRAAPLVGTHVPGGFYASGNVGFWQSERERIVRVSPGGRSPLISTSEMTLGCGNSVPSKLAAAPFDLTDPAKEELYGLVEYPGAPNHYWIVRFNLQAETCEEIVLLNSEAGSNAVPFLSVNAITSAVTPSSGLQRIRVAADGTLYFLIRPSLDPSGDGIWRVSDDNNDGVFDIEKIVDWVTGANEIWDFTIGPHDGNLYVLIDDEPLPNVGRVTVYDPDVSLGDPPLGTVFDLPATHGTQTKIEFFPLD